MASRKGSRRSKMAMQEVRLREKAYLVAQAKAAAEASVKRKRVKAAKAKTQAAVVKKMQAALAGPVVPRRSVGRPPRLGPDGKPATCGVAECGQPFRCMGYCSAHYQFARGTRQQCAPQGPADKAIGAWPMPLTETGWRPRVVGLPLPRPMRRAP